MQDEQAKKIVNMISKDVFGRELGMSLDDIQRLLTNGIALPEVAECSRTGVPVYLYDPQPQHHIISEPASMEQAKKNDWMQEKQPINTIDDFLRLWDEVNYMRGDKATESQDVAKSDSVISSHGVYMSTLIGNSKNILYSHGNFFSNYLLACRGNSSCNFGIRVFDSIYCSSSYEVRWSNKVTKSMFITDSLDLYECIACFGLRSKKYCVANIQFEKEEYMKIKAMIIDWIFEQWKKA